MAPFEGDEHGGWLIYRTIGEDATPLYYRGRGAPHGEWTIDRRMARTYTREEAEWIAGKQLTEHMAVGIADAAAEDAA